MKFPTAWTFRFDPVLTDLTNATKTARAVRQCAH